MPIPSTNRPNVPKHIFNVSAWLVNVLRNCKFRSFLTAF